MAANDILVYALHYEGEFNKNSLGAVSEADTPLRSLRSAPAQNALSPAPVSTTACRSSRVSRPTA